MQFGLTQGQPPPAKPQSDKSPRGFFQSVATNVGDAIKRKPEALAQSAKDVGNSAVEDPSGTLFKLEWTFSPAGMFGSTFTGVGEDIATIQQETIAAVTAGNDEQAGAYTAVVLAGVVGLTTTFLAPEEDVALRAEATAFRAQAPNHLMVNLTRRADQLAHDANLFNVPQSGTVSVMRVARPAYKNGEVAYYEFRDLVGVNSPEVGDMIRPSRSANERLVKYRGRHAEEALMIRTTSEYWAKQGWKPIAGGVSPNLICDKFCGPEIQAIGGVVAGGGWAYWFPASFK